MDLINTVILPFTYYLLIGAVFLGLTMLFSYIVVNVKIIERSLIALILLVFLAGLGMIVSAVTGIGV